MHRETFTCAILDERKTFRLATLKVRALIAKKDPWHSSCRKVEEVVEIFDRANEIWSQAGVKFDAEVLERRFDPTVLSGIVQAGFRRLDDAPRLGEVTGEDPRVVTALYVHSIGGSNGKVFRPSKTVLIVDDTKMPASRTTAHEIGHLFGLEHWLDSPPPLPSDRPPTHLMARTQPGTELVQRDIDHVREWLASGWGSALSGSG